MLEKCRASDGNPDESASKQKSCDKTERRQIYRIITIIIKIKMSELVMCLTLVVKWATRFCSHGLQLDRRVVYLYVKHQRGKEVDGELGRKEPTKPSCERFCTNSFTTLSVASCYYD